MSVFLSWSGPRSKRIAQQLRTWIPNVLQAAEVWMSDVDIEAGMRGIHEIFVHLEKARVGIICLTPENLTAPWLLFEAGALSKQVVEKSRVCPYLMDLAATDVPKPIAEFQAVTADEEGTRRLLKSVNTSLDKGALPEDKLEKTFAVWWPELNAALEEIRAEDPTSLYQADERTLLTEVLGSVREILRRFDQERDYYGSADAVRRSISAMREAKPEIIEDMRDRMRELFSDSAFMRDFFSTLLKDADLTQIVSDFVADSSRLRIPLMPPAELDKGVATLLKLVKREGGLPPHLRRELSQQEAAGSPLASEHEAKSADDSQQTSDVGARRQTTRPKE